MKTMIVFAIILALVLFYVLHGRAWLKTKPWMKGFFDFVEPIEIRIYRKSESVLFARFLMFMGILPALLDNLSLFNSPAIIAAIPEKYQSSLSLVFTVIGIVVEMNRRNTTKPLEIVEIPEKGMPKEVTKAIAKAEAAKVEAVTVVAEATAEAAK